MTDKYEKVEGLKAWEIVKLHEEGVSLYTAKSERFRIEKIRNIEAIISTQAVGSLYRKIETPWWEKHVGSLVMVRGDERDDWGHDLLIQVSKDGWFVCDKGTWNHARPLTKAEKDAIITEN